MVPLSILVGTSDYTYLQYQHLDLYAIDAAWEDFEFPSRVSKCLPVSVSAVGLSYEFAVSEDRDMLLEAYVELMEDLEKLPKLEVLHLLRGSRREDDWPDLSTVEASRNIAVVVQSSILDTQLLRRYHHA